MNQDIRTVKNWQDLSQKNEVRIDTHKNFTRNTPYYHASLRRALDAYFNTSLSKNISIGDYISSTSTTSKNRMNIMERQFLDEDNTITTIVFFQRYFELFLKDLLKQTHPKLIFNNNE